MIFMTTQKPLIVFAFCLFFIVKTAAIYAFDVEQVKSEIFIQLSKDLKRNAKNKPLLILIGGYPGAGKTTLINALIQTHDIDVISWNAIRQALLDRHLKGSPYDWEIIEAVNQNLFKTCIQHNANIVIDANAYGKNIKLFENLLEMEHSQDRYRIIKICLNPPLEILLSRVRAREQKESVHQGTEEDVIKDFNSEHKKINMTDYSLIVKNDNNIDFKTELNIVNSFLQPFFEQQHDISETHSFLR